MWPILYNWFLLPLTLFVAKQLAKKDEKIRASLQGREGLWERLETAIAQRQPQSKLIWFHVASAGEFLQASPLIERFLQRGMECIVTYNSVSAQKWMARRQFATARQPLLIDYLPLDTAPNIRRWIAVAQPNAVVFVKFDIWPNLVWEGAKTGLPLFLISATLQPKSRRLTSFWGRSLYGNLYGKLKGIYCVGEEDKERFLRTNPKHPGLQVMGDTRFDSVLDRKERIQPPALGNIFEGKKVLILGSSWPPDEEVVFPGILTALQQHPELCVIICPHEPSEDHLTPTESFFADFAPIRLTQLQQNPSPQRVIVVDCIGVLSSLYRVGHFAYIGGAFTTGVHNVMEPCAFGLVASFGPIHYNSPEAMDLVERGLAFPIQNSEEFEQLLQNFLTQPNEYQGKGQQAKARIEAQCGAADKCFEAISKELL